jgi:hypothetical protein
MEWTVLPHPAHSPGLTTFDYHLFCPVKDAICGSHFADDSGLNQSFGEVL